MAWTSPATWSVSEVVVASKMNLHIRDNLNYLKGVSGPTALDDRLTIPVVSGTNGKGFRFASGANDFAGMQGLDLSSNSYLISATNRYYDGTAYQQMNARAGSLVVQDGTGYWIFSTFAAASSTAVERIRMTPTGQIGIGTNAPQGALHAVASTGGGMLFLSATAVTSLQTLAVAGTVTQSAVLYGHDRNNTGGAMVQISTTPLAPGSSASLVNTDTITVAITAGGAITIQRTSGTNGTHEFQMIVVYK